MSRPNFVFRKKIFDSEFFNSQKNHVLRDFQNFDFFPFVTSQTKKFLNQFFFRKRFFDSELFKTAFEFWKLSTVRQARYYLKEVPNIPNIPLEFYHYFWFHQNLWESLECHQNLSGIFRVLLESLESYQNLWNLHKIFGISGLW